MGTELKVGIFALSAMSVIGYMVFVLSPDTFSRQDAKTYYTVVKDAAGIVKNSHVKTNGVSIGKVTKITLGGNNTEIIFEVEEDVKIPVGSQVAIKEKGLLGDVFLEIIRADDKGEFIENNQMIPPVLENTGIGDLISIAGSVGKDIKEVTSILAAVFGGEEGKETIKDILLNLRSIVATSNNIVKENKEDIRGVMIALRETTNALSKIISGREKDIQKILTDVRITSENLKEFSILAKDILNPENKDTINRIIASFDQTMENMESTASNVKLVSDKIQRGEGTLGRLINDDESLDEINSAIKEIREVLAPASKSQLTVDYVGEIRKDSTTQHYFNTYMKTRPDKFYLLGFTDHAESVKETLYEKIDPGELNEDVVVDSTSPIKTRESTVVSKAIKFNFQFGKRWNFAQLRFGLFESTGGVASDFYLYGDNISLSLEAFDWNSHSLQRRTAHFKVYTKLIFYRHISAIFGIDDISKYDETKTNYVDPNYYIGAGINFDDQDLKSILGAATLAL